MTETLLDLHDALLFDLDGTLFRGHTPVEGAVEAVKEAQARGIAVRFVTNNASRRPEETAAHLRELGFSAAVDEVATSSQAGAALLAERLAPGSRVLVVGTDALRDEVVRVGLLPVTSAEEQPDAVVQGHNPETGWKQLAEACLAIRAGALWVASNIDATLPTERGFLPGNGSMVAALRTATGTEPLVAGKPEPTLFQRAAEGTRAPLVIGDRLDTDIAGAVKAGMPSLLVLTGVSTEDEANALPAELRPTYIGANLSTLNTPVSELRGPAR
ncbi:HAD-IIA family hydrolase [Pseudonocardiaceae bacterium YIM PH 21723]|nr:HAD-IIA family hydrolase [Pseudonocardiaceae bacterium YIM PH 21723]